MRETCKTCPEKIRNNTAFKVCSSKNNDGKQSEIEIFGRIVE